MGLSHGQTASVPLSAVITLQIAPTLASRLAALVRCHRLTPSALVAEVSLSKARQLRLVGRVPEANGVRFESCRAVGLGQTHTAEAAKSRTRLIQPQPLAKAAGKHWSAAPSACAAERIREALAVPGRRGIRAIAKHFGYQSANMLQGPWCGRETVRRRSLQSGAP
jgi:hypothetical protein